MHCRTAAVLKVRVEVIVWTGFEGSSKGMRTPQCRVETGQDWFSGRVGAQVRFALCDSGATLCDSDANSTAMLAGDEGIPLTQTLAEGTRPIPLKRGMPSWMSDSTTP